MYRQSLQFLTVTVTLPSSGTGGPQVQLRIACDLQPHSFVKFPFFSGSLNVLDLTTPAPPAPGYTRGRMRSPGAFGAR